MTVTTITIMIINTVFTASFTTIWGCVEDGAGVDVMGTEPVDMPPVLVVPHVAVNGVMMKDE